MSMLRDEQINLLTIVWTLAVGVALNMLSRLLQPVPWPDWVLLGLIYWALALPQLGLRWAVGFGLVQDALTGTTFGVHGLTYVLIVQMCLWFALRVRQYRRWQQSLFAGGLLLLAGLVKSSLMVSLTDEPWKIMVLMGALTGGLLWPGVFLLLRYWRRKYQVV